MSICLFASELAILTGHNKYQKLHLLLIISLVFIQLFIGVFVVLSNVQVSLGSIHQIIGTLLFVFTTCYTLKIIRN